VSPLTRFLEVDDLDPAGLARVLDRAASWKSQAVPELWSGRHAVLFFEKPSARTRVSTEIALRSLGAGPIYVRGEEVGLGTRESPSDVARTFGSYVDALCARVFEHSVLETFVAESGVPIVNLLSDRAHPCQALADLLTLREECGALEGCQLAYVGDGNNVAASLAFAAALSGIELIVASPAGYELSPEVVDAAKNLGAQIEMTADPHEAVRGADAVYTDVWTSMGQEDERNRRLTAFDGYLVDEVLMAEAAPDAIFLHCLPAHRGEEVAGAVIDGPRSRVWQQAANRMHAIRALLAELTLEED